MAGPARIALTCGDPRGVGPEVAAAALLRLQETPGFSAVVSLIGPIELWRRAFELVGGTPTAELVDPAPAAGWGELPEVGAIAHAVRGALDGTYDAVCTGPIHKQRLLSAGFPHPGHTPYLATLCGLEPDDAVMVFAGGTLVVSLATVHVPLRRVADVITVGGVVRAASAAVELGRGVFLPASPRVALCGVNPHAGEGGRLGTEDQEKVRPAVALLRERGIEAYGPVPGDTAFARALAGEFDLVVAAFHDQGLVAVKTVDFGRSVNITAGLPILRTSVDHGTALDIAWQGRADAGPTVAALRMAVRLARAKAEVVT